MKQILAKLMKRMKEKTLSIRSERVNSNQNANNIPKRVRKNLRIYMDPEVTKKSKSNPGQS